MFPVTKSPIFKCSKCGQTDFEIGKLTINNLDGYMPWVIKCAACDTVIGYVPTADVIEHSRQCQD